MNFKIRKAVSTDIDTVDSLAIFARSLMLKRNNPQWSGGYPKRKQLIKDIENGHLFVACDEYDNPVAMMAVVPAPDENYATVDFWNTSEDFVGIHRVASKRHGGAKALFDYVLNNTEKDIRIDTHAKNLDMQRFILDMGFKYVGKHNFGFFPDNNEAFCYEYKII